MHKNIENDFRKGLTEVCNGNYGKLRSLNEITERDLAEVPIEPKESSWEVLQGEDTARKLQKRFLLQSGRHILYFVNELIRESERLNHHPVIKIDHREVTVSLTTKDFGDITERDKELSDFCDELFDDIVYINS